MLARLSLVLATLLATAAAISVAVSAEHAASGVATDIDVGFDAQKHPFVYDLPTTSYSDPPNEKDGIPAAAFDGTRPDMSYGAAVAARPRSTTQSSAGRRRARPPGPEAARYRGLVLTTILVCLVAFGIGTILGWIWPDGLRSEW
ncbi:hypothetical protein CDEST_01760 [Colletotrichum destructivum]|uniref:Uncharacterized protein n=1 Tax=Colletotrichum destructivum TaxID=34406 RepID=A0AAX4HZZ7_9PEZI|nr:hypothetical protein CDEST_01760 [Colletotrichum destructivum]